VSAQPFTATLRHDEAVLRFPYDEGLRQLLRAIPGRRWDPADRTWCVPLGAEQAEALSRLLDGLPYAPDVEEQLSRALQRRRARRSRTECLIELSRPDSDWWLSFSTDAPPEPVTALLGHPEARELETIGRAHVPLDERAIELLASLRKAGAQVRLSEQAERAVSQASGETVEEGGDRRPAEPQRTETADRHDVEFRRDRRGEHWVLIGARGAALARALAARSGLVPYEGPAGSLGLAARESGAAAIAELLSHLEDLDIDPRVEAWLARATSWRGTIDVQGPREAPLLLLLGDAERLAPAVRQRAATAPGGASLPLTLESWRLAGEHLDGWSTPAAKRCARALEQGLPAPPAVLELSSVHEEPTFVLAPGHERELLEEFAAIGGALVPSVAGGSHPRPFGRPGRTGLAGEHASMPAIRADPFCVPELDRFLERHGVWVQEEALVLLQEAREEHARSAGLVALSSAEESDLEVPGLGGELKPFQRAGVAYLLERRRSFLADEQGLGKTIEALATLQADEAFPAVVVCPANLKLNWLREVEAWLPGRTVRCLSGYGDGAGDAEEADVTIVNYDILGPRLGELLALSPRAVVIDEAHYCKNAGAKRTQAVQQLALGVPTDGIVLALSGTPVVNRPAELIAQLRILGRLEEFGSGAQFGTRFKGADAHRRLHWHLRARCFVRRLKRDVLPQLPAKTRAVVPIELDNQAEYRLAESDLLAWLRTQPLDLGELDARVAAALRAERLVRLNALKLLAARGKLNAAMAWIHDFCSSGERLVVFARHREIQRAITARFPDALHILGEDSPARRDEALRAFQSEDAPGNQIIVCSMEVAGQGLTLTRSSNVAFLELDWTPAKHDQAEDRCHRIGQQDAVNAYYLLAADTVDETIATLLERKRSVIEAVTDGREEDEEALLDALVRELRGVPYRHLRAVA
jgi:SWI/SNF-related matrix-associated actin-dependent regulator 1 of chromatin subfamily A